FSPPSTVYGRSATRSATAPRRCCGGRRRPGGRSALPATLGVAREAALLGLVRVATLVDGDGAAERGHHDDRENDPVRPVRGHPRHREREDADEGEKYDG